MGTTKVGFATIVRRLVFGAPLAAVLAACGGGYGNNSPSYTGVGGQVNCVIQGPTGGRGGAMTGTGGAGGMPVDGSAGSNGTVACTGTGGVGGTTGSAGTGGARTGTGTPRY
jgi:hypothetical protein